MTCSTPGGERAEITHLPHHRSIRGRVCSTPGGERAEITCRHCINHNMGN